METLIFITEDGEEKEFALEAGVRMSGRDYVLVSEILPEDADEEDAQEAMILVDTSSPEDEEALYVPVEDEEVLRALMPLFEEELEDMRFV